MTTDALRLPSLPIRREIILGYVSQAHWILESWIEVIKDRGVPGEDYNPEDPSEMDDFVRKLVAELKLVSLQCDALATVLEEHL